MRRTRCFLFVVLAVLSIPAGASDNGRDQPNPIARERLRVREAQMRRHVVGPAIAPTRRAAEPETGKVLVILTEFGGTDTFEFIPSGTNASTWDPIGAMDSSEWTGTAGDCSALVRKYNITGPTKYTYSGPLHNQIERPRSATDLSGWRIWTPDFSTEYYQNLIFGEGVRLSYERQDGSQVDQDLTGQSARLFYEDMSKGQYSIAGDVLGWVQVPHSIWWYGADPCPGRRSTPHNNVGHNGGIPDAGAARTLVQDAIDAARNAYPDFDWKQYDADGDGIIDHLWIIVAGISEADGGQLSRTSYGEGAMWSHSSSVSPAYEVVDGLKAGPYVMMSEATGLATMVHEYGHNLGAIDLYSYSGGNASTGFWTVMSDSWTGYPIESQPPAFDPWHLDLWGWLDAYTISDTSQEYTVKIGQTSQFPGGEDVFRGVRIQLEDGLSALPVAPDGGQQWWGGQADETNSIMTLAAPVDLPAGASASLSFLSAYNIESAWDFLWIQVSTDNGATWNTLTNSHTTCTHDKGWIGGEDGFPTDLCSASIGGFTGKSESWPSYQSESFDLTPYAGQSVLVRFWYMTDWGTTEAGPYIDHVQISSGGQLLFADDGEGDDSCWNYTGNWARNDGSIHYQQSYYLQWRNIAAGADTALNSSSWRYGPANTGLLVWYNNDFYADNEIWKYLFDPPSFGPKGKMLLVDSHADPYRDPARVAAGFPNEGANLDARGQMRDAPFSISGTNGFTIHPYMDGDFSVDTPFAGRLGVTVFSDALGYYPGAELVQTSPSDATLRWITRQWDAGVVIPSTVPYGMKAPGLTAGSTLLYNCTASTSEGTLTCDRMGQSSTASADGGTGNPGDVDGHYGWNVEILEQSDSGATLHIWNSRGKQATASSLCGNLCTSTDNRRQ
jgi:immune inhibitor A